jgi:hypothetical protein
MSPPQFDRNAAEIDALNHLQHGTTTHHPPEETDMRIKWIKSQPSTTSAPSVTAKPQFLAQDFIKLVAYAVASGVAFSALAIGVTLAVSRDSEAQTTAPAWVERDRMFVLADELDAVTEAGGSAMLDVADDTDAFAEYASPGSLYIGDGCGAEEVRAIEREWMVSIDGKVATVQVMQTFVMPDGLALAPRARHS